MCAQIKGDQVKNRQMLAVTVHIFVYHYGMRLYNSTQLKKSKCIGATSGLVSILPLSQALAPNQEKPSRQDY